MSSTSSRSDLRGPTIHPTSPLQTITDDQLHVPDELEYLQSGQPFVGTDEFFHAEDLDLGEQNTDTEIHREEETSHDTDAPYPTHIMRAASLLTPSAYTCSPGHPREYYHFWKLIMSFFFPPSQGYTLQHDWHNPATESSTDSTPTSLAVFHDWPSRATFNPYSNSSRFRRRSTTYTAPGSRSPIALIQIFSPLDFGNPLLRETAARETMERSEEAALYTHYDTLLVVSAMGTSWRAWQKNAQFTDEEAGRWGLTDEGGLLEGMKDSEWMEDVISEVSKDVLSRMCEDVKHQCSRSPSGGSP
ncbi:hypothetical protein V5O48_002257 [Marasmius crinis-equi]|uniref:Uncharacterized protein n=1 Tax=Marasmius crinis-equi TaxID=585013 RepID=A0ABR3FW53_9AGAR